MKKKVASGLSTLILSLSVIGLASPNIASADELEGNPIITHEKQGDLEITTYEYKEPIETEEKVVPIGGGFHTNYVPYDGKEYRISTKSTYKKKSWGSEIKNNSSVADSVSRSVSRNKFFNGKVSVSVESQLNWWKIVQGKVGFSGEVGFGKSKTETVSYTWNIPAKTVTTISAGSKAVKSSGSFVKYSRGKVYSKSPIQVDYSYDEYSDKKSKKI